MSDTLFETDATATAEAPTIRVPWLDDFARATQPLPDGWRWSEWSTSEEHAPKGFARLRGAVYPDKRNGRPNWAGRDKTTERTLFLSIAEFEAWKARLAAEQGVCVGCFGSGKEWAGWNVDTGNRYRDCRTCEGSGKPNA